MPFNRQHLSSLFRAFPLVLLLCLTELGQSPNQISGAVFDQTGAPIPNASVEFTEASGSRTRHTTATDDNGQFLFERVSDRRGTLTVSANGFRESTLRLTGTNVEMQIVLLP